MVSFSRYFTVCITYQTNFVSFRKKNILAEKVHHNFVVASSIGFNTCSSPNASFCSLVLKQFNDHAPTSSGMGGKVFYPVNAGIRLLCNAGNLTTWHHIPG
jgi:hypothetical protein